MAIESGRTSRDTAAPIHPTPDRTIPERNGSQRTESIGEKGLVDLLKELRDEASALIQSEIKLAKTEIGEKVEQARNGAVSMAVGGMVLFSGLIVTLLGASAGLYTLFREMEMSAYMSGWLAPLVVGAITLVVGGIMVAIGKQKVEPENLRPTRTERSLHETKAWAERKV